MAKWNEFAHLVKGTPMMLFLKMSVLQGYREGCHLSLLSILSCPSPVHSEIWIYMWNVQFLNTEEVKQNTCLSTEFGTCAFSVTQSCPTLLDPMDSSPPCSSVHGDSLGKTTGARCYPCPTLGDLPNPGIEPTSPASHLLHCRSFTY